MSHEIVNNMMAYRGAEPWHGLGVKVLDTDDGFTMLEKAGGNWLVQRRELAMKNRDGVVCKNQLSGFCAIARSDNDYVFQVSTTRYQPVQNATLIEIFREYCEAGSARMETVGFLHGGSVMWALAKLNHGTSLDMGAGDKLEGYLLMATSHDGTTKTIGKATQIRVVCNNTLSAAKQGGAAFEMKHSKKFDAAMREQAKQQLGMAIEQIQLTNDDAIVLSRCKIDGNDWLEFMSRLMGGKENVLDEKTNKFSKVAEEIRGATLTSPGSQLLTAKGTLWGAVNGVTYYADHLYGRTQDTRLQSTWFGKSDLLKRDAMRIALEMATAGV